MAGFLGLTLMLPLVVWRLLEEQHLLARAPGGYAAYQGRDRYRLLSEVW